MTDANYSLYQAAHTFIYAKGQRIEKETDVVIAGVPFDLATSGRPGARYAPTAIRQASANLGWEERRYPWTFALRQNLNIVDVGDLNFSHGDAKGAMAAVREHTARVMQAGKIPFTFGGDHLVSLPVLQEIGAHRGPVALLHFDAHTDDYAGGSEFDHGSVFYHAHEQGLLIEDKVMQVGIRTDHNRKSPFEILPADKLWRMNPLEVAERIKQKMGNAPVYLTFDIDCFDPSYAPGTGTPVSGGLTSAFIFELIRNLKGINWVGMDLTEVSPPYDQSDITSLLAATLATDMLYLLASEKRVRLKRVSQAGSAITA
ncbi:agmatinase [Bowmanella dokdonensis]|uniref:Agmatinase n=1 Tax=Bowmanella dokdonensis TaxID=751969 RepID=A0A939DRJ0_9ALTE|nr:agmatinase [Bowmanella dokdonensis]MBN7827658.1 agmatinase [Bowmanella dokdonensis]